MGAPYREPAPVPPDPYLVAWSRLRWRRRALRVGILILFVLAVPAFAGSRVPHELRGAAIALGLVIAVPVSLFLISLLSPFACPECGRPFFASAAMEIGRARACASCGLAIGTPAMRNPAVHPPHSSLRPAHRAALSKAFGWLALTLLAAECSQQVTADPWVAVLMISLGSAGATTVLIGRLIRSRTFPLALLFPMVALAVAPFTSPFMSMRMHRWMYGTPVRIAPNPHCPPTSAVGNGSASGQRPSRDGTALP
jgi:hypothetical protein